MKRSYLALILVLAVAGVALAHNGVTGFIPTIPDPNAMVIDGSEDDWAWIDADFIIAPEQIEAQSRRRHWPRRQRHPGRLVGQLSHGLESAAGQLPLFIRPRHR